jgi:hypothetical protein
MVINNLSFVLLQKYCKTVKFMLSLAHTKHILNIFSYRLFFKSQERKPYFKREVAHSAAWMKKLWFTVSMSPIFLVILLTVVSSDHQRDASLSHGIHKSARGVKVSRTRVYTQAEPSVSHKF